MSKKIEKFEQDLDRLIMEGESLLHAMNRECHPEAFDKKLLESMKLDDAQNFIENLPDFNKEYQTWYSEALALVKQTLPDRIQDFASYHEYPRPRKDITFQNYMIKDYLQGLQRVDYKGKVILSRDAAIPEFIQQLSIIKAAKTTLSSTLVNISILVQADLYDSELEEAKALADAGFLRAAGVICGVIIEKHLKQVCTNHNISMGRKKATISNLSQVLKDNEAISIPVWRSIQQLADIRNLCSHAKGDDPTKQDLQDLLSGTSKVLKTVF